MLCQLIWNNGIGTEIFMETKDILNNQTIIHQIAKFMGPTWVLSVPNVPHVDPANLAISDLMFDTDSNISVQNIFVYRRGIFLFNEPGCVPVRILLDTLQVELQSCNWFVLETGYICHQLYKTFKWQSAQSQSSASMEIAKWRRQ